MIKRATESCTSAVTHPALSMIPTSRECIYVGINLSVCTNINACVCREREGEREREVHERCNASSAIDSTYVTCVYHTSIRTCVYVGRGKIKRERGVAAV